MPSRLPGDHVIRCYNEPEPFRNDLATFRRWTGSLGALGWRASYIGAQTGLGPEFEHLVRRSSLTNFPPSAITDRMARVLHEFFLDHRDQYATPRPGLSSSALCNARYRARKRGWLTPDWYDIDGKVFTFTEHQFRLFMGRKRDRAFEGIEVLKLVARGLTDPAIAEVLHREPAHAQHWRTVRARLNGAIPDGRTWVPDHASRKRLNKIEAALDRYVADPDACPHLTLYELGVVNDRAIETYRKIFYKLPDEKTEPVQDEKTAPEKIAS